MSATSETKTRSIVKSLIWRVSATFITWATIFGATGKLAEATGITAIAALVGMLAYYIHERVWNWIAWGKVEKL